MVHYGLDFGTTNSSISFLAEGRPALLSIDRQAKDPVVIRSALYFYPRSLVISDQVKPAQIETQEFCAHQIHYEGETKTLIGSQAVEKYLNDHRSRRPGVRRKIFTGKTVHVITWTNPYSGRVYTEDIPQFFEEVDYGTGRLFHALKTALKSSFYKGSTVFGDFYSLEDLISLFVGKLRVEANMILGQSITSVKVGRPVKFSSNFIKDKAAENRLREAIKMAGFEDIKFEYEPVAAARSFLASLPPSQRKIFVFDFGGGTLDTTVVEQQNKKYEVLATGGIHIGGDLLNTDIVLAKLAKYFGSELTWGERQLPLPTRFIDGLKSWFGLPNLNNPKDMVFLQQEAGYKNSDTKALEWLIYLIQMNSGFELYESVEKAKKELSYSDSAPISFHDGPIDIKETITRSEFEGLISPRIRQVESLVIQTLKDGKTDPSEIDFVVATGGSSLIPVIQNSLAKIFDKKRIVPYATFTSIAAGLAFD